MNRELEEHYEELKQNEITSEETPSKTDNVNEQQVEESKEKKNLLKMLLNDENPKNKSGDKKNNKMFNIEDFPDLVQDSISNNISKENINTDNIISDKKVTTLPSKSKKGKKKKFEEMNSNLFKKIEANMFELDLGEDNPDEILIYDNKLSNKGSNKGLKINTNTIKNTNNVSTTTSNANNKKTNPNQKKK